MEPIPRCSTQDITVVTQAHQCRTQRLSFDNTKTKVALCTSRFLCSFSSQMSPGAVFVIPGLMLAMNRLYSPAEEGKRVMGLGG